MLKYLDNPDQDDEAGNGLPQEDNINTQISDLEDRIAYLERIIKVSEALNTTLELAPLLKNITEVGNDLAKTEGCSILLYDEATKNLKFMPATFSGGEIEVPIEDSIAGLIFKQARPILIRDVKSDPRWNRQVDQDNDFDTRSILGVPLKSKDQVIGVMEFVNKIDDAGFSQDDIEIATALSIQAAVAIENARLLDQVQQAYDDLSELDRLKSDFVSVASHELRTPLAVILGYATFLRDEVSEEGSEQLDVVLSSAMKLRSLIDSMVNLRHVQNNDIQLDSAIFSMRELVIEVLLEFQTLISAKSFKVKVRFLEGDEDPVNIEADRQKVYLIVANLISNAIKFTPEYGFIMITLSRDIQNIYLQVADTGIGIPDGRSGKIFDDFYQVEPSLTRRHEGMGLGLPIVKGMVDVHQGQIIVDSIEGRGSRFAITLPISQGLQY